MAKDQSSENKNKSITLSQTREGAFVCSKDEPSLLNTNKPLAFGEYCFPFYELKDPLEQVVLSFETFGIMEINSVFVLSLFYIPALLYIDFYVVYTVG